MRKLWKGIIIGGVTLALLGGGSWAVLHYCFKSKPKVEKKKEESPHIAFARGKIDVDGGLVNIAAKKDGIIKELLVDEGDRVKKDQVLCKQDDIAERLSLDLYKAQVSEAERKVERDSVKLEAAKREDERHKALASQNIISKKDFDERHDTLRNTESELAIGKASLESAKRNLAIAEYNIEQRIVRAPADGTILRCEVRPGYGTTSSSNVTRLFVFVPDLPFIVRAELEEKFVRQVKRGTKAEVIPDADETKSYSATVIRVGNYLGPKRMSFDDPNEKSDVRTAECVLSIDSKDLMLQQRVLVKFFKEGKDIQPKKDDKEKDKAAAPTAAAPAAK